LGAVMLLLAGAARDRGEATTTLERRLADGSALARFRAMCEAHGADVRAVDDPSRLAVSPPRAEVHAQKDGVIEAIDAHPSGLAGSARGGARLTGEDVIDRGAGSEIVRGVGERVRAGDVLARIAACDDARAAQGAAAVTAAFAIGSTASTPAGRLLHVVTADG